MGVREAVKDPREALEDPDRWLVIALARGDAYDDLIAAHPQLNNKVAVSRAVSRVGTLLDPSHRRYWRQSDTGRDPAHTP